MQAIDLPRESEDCAAAEGDLSYAVQIEVLPKFEVGSFADVEITRIKADVPEEEIQQAIDRMASQNRSYSAKAEGAASEKGDKLTIDFDKAGRKMVLDSFVERG